MGGMSRLPLTDRALFRAKPQFANITPTNLAFWYFVRLVPILTRITNF